jgi:hypothetical protein
MIKASVAILTLFALGACTPETGEPLAVASAAPPVGPAVACINLDQVTARRPGGPGAVVFELAGGKTYRNDVQGACPSLENANKADILSVQADSTRLCRNDSVRIFDPVEAKGVGIQAFPKCRLGNFTPIARR